MNTTPEYNSFRAAKARCRDPRNNRYADYGAKGIEFRFTTFDQWVADLGGPRPSPSHTVDRKDPLGHYEPGNVQWATRSQQSRNRTDRKLYTIGLESKLLCEWAEVSGLSVKKIFNRIYKSRWCVACAVFQPRCPHITAP